MKLRTASGSGSPEEADRGGYELVVVLENAAVPGVGVDDQRRVLDRTLGTMRSWSPLAMSVGWVILDRSAGVDRP